MLFSLIITGHIMISILLVAVVLMQSGRGGGLAGAFGGGGGSQTLFGGRGATTFLTKATWILGSAFMLVSLLLALAIGKRQTGTEERSLLRENPVEAPASSLPLTPAEREGEPSGAPGTPPSEAGAEEKPGSEGP